MTAPSCTRRVRILCVRLYLGAPAALAAVAGGQFSTVACAWLGLGQALRENLTPASSDAASPAVGGRRVGRF